MQRCLLVLYAALLATGCAHNFETRKFDVTSWTPGKAAVSGVVYYQPHFVLVEKTLTARAVDGIVVATSENGGCLKTSSQEIVIKPDFNDPQVIINKPSLFASGQLEVKFSEGMLTSLNTQSNPELQEFLGELRQTAKTLLEEGRLARAMETDKQKAADMKPLPCNAQAMITRFESCKLTGLPGAKAGTADAAQDGRSGIPGLVCAGDGHRSTPAKQGSTTN